MSTSPNPIPARTGVPPLSLVRRREESLPAIDGKKMYVTVVRDAETLARYADAWEELSAAAIEPNVFYDPWMLLPALQLFGQGRDIRIALVFAPDPARPQGEPVLCGLFPLEYQRRYKGLPVSALHFWKHEYCTLCTPLVRAGCARETLNAFFDWIESDAETAPLLELEFISGDGPFYRALVEQFYERKSLVYTDERFTRALLDMDQAGGGGAGFSGRHMKEVRRKEKKLSHAGRVSYASFGGGDAEPWIEQFLALEASGWKGREGSALASSEADRKYFQAIARGAARRGQLMMSALMLDGEPIAMKCNFISGPGSYAFKIGFDERFGQYSPGILLEVENMRRLEQMPGIRWMDSCAVPNHFMINRLWPGRRCIQTLTVATGKRPGELVISLLPLLRWARRKLRSTGEWAKGNRHKRSK